MRQISIREVQHHLARVLAFVQDGEEVEITRRDAVVARIIPAAGTRGVLERARRPDYRARLGALFPEGSLQRTPAGDEIRRGRGPQE